MLGVLGTAAQPEAFGHDSGMAGRVSRGDDPVRLRRGGRPGGEDGAPGEADPCWRPRPRDSRHRGRELLALGRGEAQRGGDRKSVVKGKSVSVRVDLGGSRIIKKKRKIDYKERDSKSSEYN